MAKKKSSPEFVETISKTPDHIVMGVTTTTRTLEAALEAAEVDLNIWTVKTWKAAKWDGQARIKAGEHKGKLNITELWYVSIELIRKIPKPITDALDALYHRQKKWKPKVFKNSGRLLTDPHMFEMALFDAHFGKLCWGQETGTEFNLKTINMLYSNAADDLIKRANGFNIERFLIPIGNDFFHVNNWLNTTQKGTPQDVDTRFQKVFEVGCDALVRLVESCLRVANVDLLWVPGNHDFETSWYLTKYLEAWYRNVSEVRVNKDPVPRKYVGYGKNLIGFTHGNEEKHERLPTLMATEQPQLWAASEYRAWHLGHFHKKGKTKYIAGDTYNGVTIDILPSLSGTDAWHFRQGYVKNSRAAEGHLWSRDDGPVAVFNAKARLT